MPQNINHRKAAAAPSSSQKKKKKGHAPAHQNAFAFKHNPNSKKTQKILEMPNTHVCRRCHDKIEWRKQYRKYKPRTQPGKCNICQQRRVKAAYHTVCEKCTLSEKAKKSVRDNLGLLGEETDDVEKGVEKLQISTQDKDEAMPEEEKPVSLSATADGGEGAASTTTSNSCTNSVADSCSKSQNTLQQQQTQTQTDGRACAMCVKDWALPDSDDEEEDDPLASGRRIPLRQRKTLERQREKQMNAKRRNPREENDEDDEEDGSQNSNGNDDSEEDDFGSDHEDNNNHLDDEEDPFLKAVGGADKLLTGEAYQQALLQKEKMLQQKQIQMTQGSTSN